MSFLDRVRADEARRQRRQREDLDALSHATGGLSPRVVAHQATFGQSPFTRAALAGRLPAKDLTRR